MGHASQKMTVCTESTICRSQCTERHSRHSCNYIYKLVSKGAVEEVSIMHYNHYDYNSDSKNIACLLVKHDTASQLLKEYANRNWSRRWLNLFRKNCWIRLDFALQIKKVFWWVSERFFLVLRREPFNGFPVKPLFVRRAHYTRSITSLLLQSAAVRRSVMEACNSWIMFGHKQVKFNVYTVSGKKEARVF